jgi:hypothetical protein
MMTREHAVSMVTDEMDRAEKKWPGWPTDPVHGAGIVCEESGELMQAALQYTYEGATDVAMIREAIHTAATALRFIQHMAQNCSRPSERP